MASQDIDRKNTTGQGDRLFTHRREWAQQWHRVSTGESRGVTAFLVRVVLALLASIYGVIVRCRRLLYRVGVWKPEPATIPVISIGNITVGGTGKTPCVELIARHLLVEGWQIAILSRGYGSDFGANDEALVLEENLPDVPHLQGANRAELLKVAVEELEREVVLLDDGFQHLRLQRHLDIVLVDATNPWGYGWLLPRGMLREPPSVLKFANVIIVTKSDLVSAEKLSDLTTRIQRIAPQVPVCFAVHEPVEWVNNDGEVRPIHEWRNLPAAAFCGIGNPHSFRRSLADLGVTARQWRVFPDHHAYSRDDVEELHAWAAALPPNGIVLTTQKDLVKLRLPTLGDRPLWSLRVAFRVTRGFDLLIDRVRKLLTT